MSERDPFAATPAQLHALWDVADKAKVYLRLGANYAKTGSGKKARDEALKELGISLSALDYTSHGFDALGAKKSILSVLEEEAEAATPG